VIEEVLRFRGYEGVPPFVPFHSIDAPTDGGVTARDRVLDAMVGLGFHEVRTTCFMSPQAIERLGGPEDWTRPVVLANPVNKEMPLLRTAVLPSLLDVVRRNRNVGERDLRFFEIGKVFRRESRGNLESWVLAGAMMGEAGRPVWGSERRFVDFFDGKGALWGLAEALDIDTPDIACYDGEMLETGASARLTGRGRPLGLFGMLSRKVRSAWELPDPVFVFELDLDGLCGMMRTSVTYEQLPRYPKARRDVALVVDERRAAGDVLSAVRGLREPLLEAVALFDVYRGEQLPAGKKSLAFAMTYMSRERTLTDEEVDGAHARIVEHLKGEFGASVR
jgi:phenylalanyl-tRNA synthetase beta chain